MAPNEKELVTALEADIQKWEFVAGFFEPGAPGADFAPGAFDSSSISLFRSLVSRFSASPPRIPIP